MTASPCRTVEELLAALSIIKTHSDVVSLLSAASESILNEWFLVANPTPGFEEIYCELTPKIATVMIRECDEYWYFVLFPGVEALHQTQFVFTPEDVHRENWKQMSDLFYTFWYRAGGQRAG